MTTFNLHLHPKSIHIPFNWHATQSKSRPARLVADILHTLNLRIEEWKYRRTLSDMLGYDDHVLEDIGMTRAELLMALELPLSEDAGKALAQWKAERRITG